MSDNKRFLFLFYYLSYDAKKPSLHALQLIAAIYHAENKLQDLSCEERQKERDKKVRPLVDAFFAWVHKTAEDKTLLLTEDTRKGIQYCINQEEYLREFLNDGEIPLDNNLALSAGITYPHLLPEGRINTASTAKRCA